MAEEQKQDLYVEIPKGFISLQQPFVMGKNDEGEEIQNFITIENYQQYLDSLNEEGFNSKGVPNYEFNFYEIQDQDFPCQLIPESTVSSDENEVSPLDWNLYSSCVKVGKNKFIITGGIKSDDEYAKVFYKKAELIVELKSAVKNLEALIQEFHRKVENESEQDRRHRLFYIVQAASTIKQDDINLDGEPNVEKKIDLSIEILEKEKLKLKFRLEQKAIKLDKDYCKSKKYEYQYKEDLPEDTLFFDKFFPYSSSTIEVTFKFNSESNKFEFTGTYLENLPQGLSNHQSIFHKGKVIVLGGVSNQILSSSVYAYDVLSATWTTLPSLTSPRINFAAASHGDSIYVFGGQTKNFRPIEAQQGEDKDDSTFSYLEKLNPDGESQKWEKFTLKKKLKGNLNFQVFQQIKLLSIKDQLVFIGGNVTKEAASEKSKVLISKVEFAADKFSFAATEDQLSVRKGESIYFGNYSGRDCYYCFGGVPFPYLECVAIDVKDGQLDIEKIVDNNYSEEYEESYSDHILTQPTLYIE